MTSVSKIYPSGIQLRKLDQPTLAKGAPYEAEEPTSLTFRVQWTRASVGRCPVLELVRLVTGQLATGEGEDLFVEQLQDLHVVFAEVLVRPAGSTDIRDETGPVLRPFLLNNLQVRHGYQCLLEAPPPPMH
jgi:hypothetical protein